MHETRITSPRLLAYHILAFPFGHEETRNGRCDYAISMCGIWRACTRRRI